MCADELPRHAEYNCHTSGAGVQVIAERLAVGLERVCVLYSEQFGSHEMYCRHPLLCRPSVFNTFTLRVSVRTLLDYTCQIMCTGYLV